jgi:hypothetical protein
MEAPWYIKNISDGSGLLVGMYRSSLRVISVTSAARDKKLRDNNDNPVAQAMTEFDARISVFQSKPSNSKKSLQEAT